MMMVHKIILFKVMKMMINKYLMMNKKINSLFMWCKCKQQRDPLIMDHQRMKSIINGDHKTIQAIGLSLSCLKTKLTITWESIISAIQSLHLNIKKMISLFISMNLQLNAQRTDTTVVETKGASVTISINTIFINKVMK